MAPVKPSLERLLQNIFLFFFAAVSISDVVASDFPDTVFIGGNIVTVDEKFRSE